jgi:hypothetical protein
VSIENRTGVGEQKLNLRRVSIEAQRLDFPPPIDGPFVIEWLTGPNDLADLDRLLVLSVWVRVLEHATRNAELALEKLSCELWPDVYQSTDA